MSFEKNFKITKEKGLELQDIKLRNDYLKNKIKIFSEYQNFVDKNKLLSLLQEIINMIDEDNMTATFDISDIEDIRFFDLKKHKKTMIAYYDIVLILGSIFLNTFNCPTNKLKNVEDGINGLISTSQMLMVAYTELEKVKGDNTIPYGANLIFATLLEKELKAIVKIEYVKDWLLVLQQKIDSGQTIIDSNDNDYFVYLNHQYELSNISSTYVYDGVMATTSELYKFLCKYDIISQDDNYKMFICNKLTLNNFLNSTFSSSKIHPLYLNIIKMLLSTSCLNLRNNLAHCNFGYLNYHTSCVGALLYGLLFMIFNRSCLK